MRDADRLTKKEAEYRAKNRRLYESCKKGLDQIYDNEICDLVWECLDIANEVQFAQLPGIYDQLYRALNSILANYAEGIGRTDTQDMLKFLKTSRGSAYEAHAHSVCLGHRQLADTVRKLCAAVDRTLLNRLEEELSKTEDSIR